MKTVPVVLFIVVAVAASLLSFTYGSSRGAGAALRETRARYLDSLAIEQALFDSQLIDRQMRIDSLKARQDTLGAALRAAAARRRSTDTVFVKAVAELDEDEAAPIVAHVEALEEEVGACNSALAVCAMRADSLSSLVLDLRAWGDTVRHASDSLRLWWEDAERRADPPFFSKLFAHWDLALLGVVAGLVLGLLVQ